MATLSFSCPKCQRGFDKVKAEMAGSKVKCQCGHIFRLGPKKTKPSAGPPTSAPKPAPKPAPKRTSGNRAQTQPPQRVPTSDPVAETKPTPVAAKQPEPSSPPAASRPSAAATRHDAEVDELISFAAEPKANSIADSDSFDGLDDSAELDQLLAQPTTPAQSPSAARPRSAGADSADDLLPVADAPTPRSARPQPTGKPVGAGIDLKKNSPLAGEDDLELLDDDLELLDDDLEILDDQTWSQPPLAGAPSGSVYPQVPAAAPVPSPYGAPAPGGYGAPQPYPGGMAPAAPNPYGNPYAPVGPPLQTGYSGARQFPTWVITAPGIAMIVCGTLDLLWVLFIMARTFGAGVGLAMMPETEFGPPMAEGVKEFVITTTIISAAISLILLAVALSVLMGGINMVKRTGYGRAIAGAICAILPCAIMDVAVVEIGIGIWALVVLCMEGYRRQFD